MNCFGSQPEGFGCELTEDLNQKNFASQQN